MPVAGREGLRSNAAGGGRGGWDEPGVSRPCSSEETCCREPGSAVREGMVEGGFSLGLRKPKMEVVREWVTAIEGDGRRVGEVRGETEPAAVESGRPEETNSRASGDVCRKCWS